MKSYEIRKSFLNFFASKGHTVVASDTLVPKGDPTLLFTTAGMVQFKPLYAGAPLQFKRAASCQKCLRAGGKGSDLENVGKTIRHHTFFEMLGNFSFGDYFKEDAIIWAWEFLTKIVALNPEKLFPSVFKDDDEAFLIWHKKIGLSEKKIVRLGEKDNFWGPAGDSGACGPCSEIYFDLGPARGCGKSTCMPGCDCERFIEIWNLVFPQFNQSPDGSRKTLARRGIDTGMGLERVAFVSEGLESNYASDLFKPTIHEISKYTQHPYQPKTQMAYHVIADHVRALTFAIGDEITPSNEGRGYVLRRILRRASRYAQKLEICEPILYKLVAIVVDLMKEVYPELVEARENIARMIKFEEERFIGTISFGLSVLEDLMKTQGIASPLGNEGKIISGEDLFRLYDTYGFPLEMAQEVAEEEGFSIDEATFKNLMSKQKERSRASWVGTSQVGKTIALEELKTKIGPTEFLGYQGLSSDAKVLAILKDNQGISEAQAGEKIDILLNRSPFYGEGGGQVGDKGILNTPKGEIQILDTQWPIEGLTVHRGEVKRGVVRVGDEVLASVDPATRAATARHHTATHLLHYALRKVLGSHVKQAGSLVNPERFRFDFAHFTKPQNVEIEHIESLVNEKIVENTILRTLVLPIEEARKVGAIAFFGDKYGGMVRVIDIGGYSIEFCGGTHVKATGEIGLFKIFTESSVASGVRRIEAASGLKAYESVRQTSQTLSDLCTLLSVSPQEAFARMEKLLNEKKHLEKKFQAEQMDRAQGEIEKIFNSPQKIKEAFVYIGSFENLDNQGLRSIADQLKSRVSSGVIVVVSQKEGRAFILSMVTDDWVKKGFHAGKIVQALAKKVDGGGGGKPELAQAGGKDPSKLPQALASLSEIL